ncbi:MAG: alpha/beta fold hydrolase [Candidatus Acidiferrales bacterium]
MLRRISLPIVLLLISRALAFAASEPPAPHTVDLTAADGTALKATFFAAAAPGPGVILFHQCNQQRHNWDDLAARLAAAGINVLTVDYRGFGESSGGRFAEITQQQRIEYVDQKWPGDMDVAFHYLVSQSVVAHDIIGAGGASCGVHQAIQLAHRHPEVKSLVLLSGDTNRDGRHFLQASANLPLFVSVADDDGDTDATNVMEFLVGVSPNPGNKFVHYKTGGHGTAMFLPHPELLGMIVDWFVTTLEKTPGSAPANTISGMPREEVQALELIDEPGGADKVAKMLADARQHDPNAVLFPEIIVNGMGYGHLQIGDTKGAIRIFKLNVAGYPKSPNVYDSLSDAYLADGQKDQARLYAKRALDALASDATDDQQRRDAIKTSAEQKLKDLGDPPK